MILHWTGLFKSGSASHCTALHRVLHCIELCWISWQYIKLDYFRLVKHYIALHIPCEQRLHFRCVSWHAKSSLCRQPFKSVQKSGWINKKKNGFFPVHDWLRALRKSCVADQSFVAIFLFPQNSHHLTTDLTINFAYKSRDVFHICTIENWTVVSKGYFVHASSHSKFTLCSQGTLHTALYWFCVGLRDISLNWIA